MLLSKQYIFTIILSLILAILFGILSAFSPKYSLVTLVFFLIIVFYFKYKHNTFWIFISIMPFLPNYFSFKFSNAIPVISAYRVCLIAFIFDQIILKKRFKLLLYTILHDKNTKLIMIYSTSIIMVGFVHLFKGNNTAFSGTLSILIENVAFYYLILMNIKIQKDTNNIQKIDKLLLILCNCSFVLSILGIIERITSFNIFTLLETSNVEGVQANTFMRLNEIRVMTSFPHALGYGLYLLLMIPIVCYQIDKYKRLNQKQYQKYLLLFFLLLLNIFFTSSRSVLIAFLSECLLFFIFSNFKRKMIILYFTFLLFIPTITFSLTPYADNIPIFSAVSKNVKSLSDTFLHTSLNNDFGSNEEPFSYREELIKYAFNLRGCENLFGKGIGFIRTDPLKFFIPELNPYDDITSITIDNYYINVKLEQGLFVMITTLFLFVIILFKLFIKRNAHKLNIFLLISFTGYFINLTMVNDLGTIKYFWLFIAMFAGTNHNKDILIS